jgi:hypothetical protein
MTSWKCWSIGNTGYKADFVQANRSSSSDCAHLIIQIGPAVLQLLELFAVPILWISLLSLNFTALQLTLFHTLLEWHCSAMLMFTQIHQNLIYDIMVSLWVLVCEELFLYSHGRKTYSNERPSACITCQIARNLSLSCKSAMHQKILQPRNFGGFLGSSWKLSIWFVSYHHSLPICQSLAHIVAMVRH